MDVVVLALDRPIAAQRVLGAETEHRRIANLVTAGRSRSGRAKSGRGSIERMLLVRHGDAGLGKNEPAIGRKTCPACDGHKTVDLRSGGLGTGDAKRRAADADHLRTGDVGPRTVEFEAEHEAGNLLVDADLPAGEETARDEISVLPSQSFIPPP